MHKQTSETRVLGLPLPQLTDAGPADPHVSEPIVVTGSQTPSALGLGDGRKVRRGCRTSNTRPHQVFTRLLCPPTGSSSTTSVGARSWLVSDVTDDLAALLHHPAGLYTDMRRESFFNLRAMMR